MFMKVHPKGQVVIPAEVRKQLGIEVGDVLEVDVIAEEGKLELRRPVAGRARSLAGSLKQYAVGKRFPSERRIAEIFRDGVTRDG